MLTEIKGITDEQLKELGIADSTDGLTRNEVKELIVLANARGNQGSSRGREEVGGSDRYSDAQESQVRYSIANDEQLSIFIQNNSGEYETQDGQTIGFATLPDGDNSSVDSGIRPGEVQREDRGADPTSYHLRKLVFPCVCTRVRVECCAR